MFSQPLLWAIRTKTGVLNFQMGGFEQLYKSLFYCNFILSGLFICAMCDQIQFIFPAKSVVHHFTFQVHFKWMPPMAAVRCRNVRIRMLYTDNNMLMISHHFLTDSGPNDHACKQTIKKGDWKQIKSTRSSWNQCVKVRRMILRSLTSQFRVQSNQN